MEVAKLYNIGILSMFAALCEFNTPKLKHGNDRCDIEKRKR